MIQGSKASTGEKGRRVVHSLHLPEKKKKIEHVRKLRRREGGRGRDYQKKYSLTSGNNASKRGKRRKAYEIKGRGKENSYSSAYLAENSLIHSVPASKKRGGKATTTPDEMKIG